MSKPAVRPYSRIARQASTLLGRQIRLGRKENGMTAQELADRAGISRGLVQRIEKGDPGCQIGTVLETAAIVGIHLFGEDEAGVSSRLRETTARLTLLPKHTHPRRKLDDAF